MAITFVGSDAAAQPGPSATVTPTIHASAQSGDVMVAFVAIGGKSLQAWSDDGGGQGWTLLLQYGNSGGKDRDVAVYYKVHDGTEADPTFTYGATDEMLGFIFVLRDVDTTTPFDVTYVEGTHNKSTTNTTNPTPKPITTATDGAVVLLLGILTDSPGLIGTPGTSSGYDFRVSDTSNDANAHGATKEIATAGVETPGVLTNTGTSETQESTFITLAIRPASGGGISDTLTPGSFLVTGATIAPSISAPLAVGAFLVTGSSITVTISIGAVLTPGSFLVTGATIAASLSAPLTAGSFLVTGSSISTSVGTPASPKEQDNLPVAVLAKEHDSLPTASQTQEVCPTSTQTPESNVITDNGIEVTDGGVTVIERI